MTEMMAKSKGKENGNAAIYRMVSDTILAELEKGHVPWETPWNASTGGRPRRMNNGDVYKGLNVWLLGIKGMEEQYPTPYWGTFDQIAELAGMVKTPRASGHGTYWRSPDGEARGVRKGETGTRIIFWKDTLKHEPDNPEADKNGNVRLFFARSWSVFNAAQADHLPEKFFPRKTDDIGEVADLPEPDAVIKTYIDRGPSIRRVYSGRAYYEPTPDRITLPEAGQFKSPGARYVTEFHELAHSTGHPRRLNRPGIATFDHHGSEQYAREELVAHLAASMLCLRCGITPEWEQQAAYIQGWMTAIREDPKLFTSAATQAEKAMTFITEE